MLSTPPDCPIPGARSFSAPEGKGSLGVLILGESLGDSEAADGLPFRPHAQAGSLLERAIRRSGFTREQFVLWNVVPVQPPHNYLEGAPYEAAAVAWGTQYLRKVIDDYKPRCILALGNVALRTASGMCGPLRGISHLRGFVLDGVLGVPVVGSFHPAFIRRGAMPLTSVLMHDLKLAVAVAHGRPTCFYSPVLSRDFEVDLSKIWTRPMEPRIPPEYILHPTERDAYNFLNYMEKNPDALLAYDIETPRSAAVNEDESDELGEVQILSIQFSPRAGAGIYMPWREPFDVVARRVLALPNPKAGANTWRFDDPLLRAHGCQLNGELHDVRWAFHHLQPDLKSSLQFMGSFYALEMGPWKHLHESHPELYGVMDTDATWRICGQPEARTKANTAPGTPEQAAREMRPLQEVRAGDMAPSATESAR